MIHFGTLRQQRHMVLMQLQFLGFRKINVDDDMLNTFCGDDKKISIHMHKCNN